MKEYWVNVYEFSLGNKYVNEYIAKAVANKTTRYRLHVREFDTKEAKELYLKMKYGIVSATGKLMVNGLKLKTTGYRNFTVPNKNASWMD